MGIHVGSTGAEHLHAVAGLRLSDGAAAMDLERGRDCSTGHILHLARADVHPELRSGGLGNS